MIAPNLTFGAVPRGDGVAPPRDSNDLDWTYRILNQLKGNYRADPGMAIDPQVSPAMPLVPDYNLNQHLPTEGIYPASVGPSINPSTGCQNSVLRRTKEKQ